MKRAGGGSERRLANKRRKLEAFLALAENQGLSTPGNPETPAASTAQNVEAKPKLSGDDYEALRKRLRERKKALQNIPQLTLKPIGQDASLSLPNEMRKPLLMRDLQYMLLYALMGTKAPVEPSRWCKFVSWSKLSKVVLLVLDGIGLKEYQTWLKDDSKFSKTFGSIFEHKLQLVSSYSYGSTVTEDLCVLPLSAKELSTAQNLYGNVEKAIMANADYTKVMRTVFPIASTNSGGEESSENEDDDVKVKLLLTLDQLHTFCYPVPNSKAKSNAEGFVMTKERYAPVTADSPVYAIDCEMVMTTTGDHELAAVCLMDSEFKVLYKSYVRPHNTVTNYMTKFSGITAQMLAGITTRLSDVQEQVCALLPPNAILAGHSLENDLRALKLFHPYVIDTSLCFNMDPTRARKSKLKHLAKIFLEKDIQMEKQGGHDPEEDAKATMELVLLKLKNGYKFGDMYLQGGRMAVPVEEAVAMSSLKRVENADQTIQVIACEKELEVYRKVNNSDQKLIEATSSGEAVKKSKASCQENQLTICHLACQEDSSKSVKKKTKKLWESLPSNGLLLTVWSGTGETNPAMVGIGIKKAEIPTADPDD